MGLLQTVILRDAAGMLILVEIRQKSSRNIPFDTCLLPLKLLHSFILHYIHYLRSVS